MIPPRDPPTSAQPSAGADAEIAKAKSGGFWACLRPLAYLAPLAVNWPGGRVLL